MMYRRISLCIALLLCLWVFASCDRAEDGLAMISDTADNTIDSAVTEINEEASDDMPWVTKKQLRITSDDGADVRINASYPVFDLADEAVSGRINGQIEEFIDSNYGRYYNEEYRAAVESLDSTMLYDITLFDEALVSVHFYGSFVGSGATQYVNDTAFTFDLATGERVSLFTLYSHEKLSAFIDGYFDKLDESAYPTLFGLYTKEKVRNDFLGWFDPEAKFADTASYGSYYLTEDKLYLIAGHYKGYTHDIESELQGDRSFIAEIDVKNGA